VPEFGSSHSDRPALDELAHTDLLLDALAQRQLADSPLGIKDPDDVALAALLEDWRDDLRWPPASALVSPEEAVEALRTGLADRRRGRRGLAAIGSVAATLLVLSGFGAVVVEARPGDALYGLHAMFFDQPRVSDNSIELSAKADLAKVQQMIDQGEWDQAHSQLAEVSSTVQSIDDGAGKHDLMDEVNLLNTRVQSRNPNATVPPAAPPSAGPAAGPASKGAKPPKAPAASTTPPPSQSLSPSPTPSASPSTTTPSSGRHRHHSQSSDAPSTTP
jgi:Anti-sigma-D factor RsdA to sigma factor binding region